MRDRNGYDETPGISNSMLRAFAQHPRIYHGRYVAKTLPAPPPSKAMLWGLALEERLWGGGTQAITIIPEAVLSSGARRGNAWKAYAAEHEGEILMKQSEYDEHFAGLDRASQNIEAHRQASGLLIRGDCEVWHSVQWICPNTGMPRKGEIDVLHPKGIVDLKTIADTSPGYVARQVCRYGYHQQGAGYQEAVQIAHGTEMPILLVCVRNCEPFDVAVYELSPKFLEIGHARNLELLQQLDYCQRNDCWERPGTETILALEPPRWASFDEYALELELSE